MKKLMKIVMAVAIMGAFTACKKDYTCECSVTDTSTNTVLSSSSTTAKMTKSDAEEWCTGYNVTSGTLKTECKLK